MTGTERNSPWALPLPGLASCGNLALGRFHMPRLCDRHREFSLMGWLKMKEVTHIQCEGLCDCELDKIENHDGNPVGTLVRE